MQALQPGAVDDPASVAEASRVHQEERERAGVDSPSRRLAELLTPGLSERTTRARAKPKGGD